MGRYSPSVLPTVQRDPFDALFSGLRGGYEVGTEFAERGHQRRREEAQDKRSEEYLDLQRRHARAAEISQAIERAREGFVQGPVPGRPSPAGSPTLRRQGRAFVPVEPESDVPEIATAPRVGSTQPGEDLIEVPGQGYIDFNRSVEGFRHRASERAYNARQDAEQRRQQTEASALADAIARGDDAYVLSRSPQAYTAGRPRDPIVGSPEWMAAEKFKTDEAIREANRTGRYRDRSGSTTNPRVSQLSTSIDDTRAEIGMLEREAPVLSFQNPITGGGSTGVNAKYNHKF